MTDKLQFVVEYRQPQLMMVSDPALEEDFFGT